MSAHAAPAASADPALSAITLAATARNLHGAPPHRRLNHLCMPMLYSKTLPMHLLSLLTLSGSLANVYGLNKCTVRGLTG